MVSRSEIDRLLLGQTGSKSGDDLGAKEYELLFGQTEFQKAARLRTTLDVAAAKKPDRQADVFRISKAMQLPAEMVDRNFDYLKARYDSNQAMRLIRDTPVLSQWIENPINAEISHDDLEGLSKVDRVLNFAGNLGRSLATSLPNMHAAAIGVFQAFTDTMSELNRSLWGDPTLGGTVPDPYADVQKHVVAERKLAEERATRWKGDRPASGFIEQSIYSGAESLGQNLLLLGTMAATGGGSAAVLGGMGALTAGTAYGQARDAGTSIPKSLAFSTLQGVIEVATEKIPVDALLKDLRLNTGLVKTLGRQLAGEIPGEQVATILQDMNEWAVLNPGKPFASYLADRPSAAAQTLIATVVGTVGQAGITRVAHRAVMGKPVEQVFFEQLGKGVSESKTYLRLPEKLREFIAAATKDGPLENVYQPIDTWNTYWQDQKADPRAVADEMGLADEYDQAAASGSDLQIPLAVYAEKLAATEHNGYFAQELRFNPDEMNGREAAAYIEQAVKTEQENREKAGTTEEKAALIGEDIIGQLVGQGYDRSSIEAYAKMYEAFFNASVGERAGFDPKDFFDRYDLRINRPLPDILKNVGKVDALDSMIDRIRKGDIPKIEGQTVIQFLRSKGGLKDEGGDVASMEPDKGRTRSERGKAGRNLVQKDTGLAIDSAVELLREAGYLPAEDSDAVASTDYGSNKVLELIDEELRGNPTYSAETHAAWAVSSDFEEAMVLNQLDEFLAERGVNLRELSNEEIKKIINDAKGMEREGGGVEFNQSGAVEFSVLHKLSSENLLFADSMGGLAVPSLAVVTGNMSMSGYGDVTLIGRKELGDPNETPIFDADIYSATFPRPEYPKVKAAVAQKVVNEATPFVKLFNDWILDDAIYDKSVNDPKPGDLIRDVLRSNAGKAWFLSTALGTETAPVIRDKKIEFGWTQDPEFRKAFAEWQSGQSEGHDGWEDRLNKLTVAARSAVRKFALADPDFKKYEGLGWSEGENLARYARGWGDGAEWVANESMRITFVVASHGISRSVEAAGKTEIDAAATEDMLGKLIEGHEAQFKEWVDAKILGMFGRPFIKIGSEKLPYTLQSAVEYMTSSKIRAKEKTMTFGEGKARAAAAKRFGTLDEMRRYADQIGAPEDIDAARAEAKAAIEGWRNRIVKHYGEPIEGGREFGRTWEGLDASMKAIARWARGGKTEANLEKALMREGFRSIPEGLLEDGVVAGKLFLKAPVPYFEAKPQRAVLLSEFAGAVIPMNASDAVRGVLLKHKIPFREFDSSGKDLDENTAAQNAVVAFRKELAAKGEKVLFQSAHVPVTDKPPTNESSYISDSEYQKSWRAMYSDASISSRTTPITAKLPPVGAWRIDDHKGIHGREIAQLRVVNVADLQLPELWEGKLDPSKRGDDERYAEWLKEGKRPPPIEVLQGDKLGLIVTDGHRRALAAKLAGRDTVEAWVSPVMDHPEGLKDSEGRILKVGATFEGATAGVKLYQAAYHGSPHIFDQFSLHAIGTGEGAQAYGWGLYFAGNKEIAAFYKRKLAGKPTIKVDGHDWHYGGTESPVDLALGAILDAGSIKGAIELLENWKEEKLRGQPSFGWETRLRHRMEAVSWLKESEANGRLKVTQPGRLYKVDIPEDSEYLDYDKVLSAQHEKIQKAIAGIATQSTSLDFSQMSIQRLHDLIMRIDHNADLDEIMDDDETTDDQKKEQLIEVLTSLDEDDPGSVQDYLAVKGGFTPNQTGGGIYNQLVSAAISAGDPSPEKTVSERLAAAGIAGIKYLDNNSRNLIKITDRRTWNYVLFDDKLIKILEYEQNLGDGKRGAIRISADRKINIDLFAKADLSTFIHETGHFFLEAFGDLAEEVGGISKQPPIAMFNLQAQRIESSIPAVANGYTRLWRGNRKGEVGSATQFTNDLPGIALPFRNAYGGDLSYVDVITADLPSYENKVGGAPGAEFAIPKKIASGAAVVAGQDTATLSESQRKLQEDYAALLKYLGVESRDKIDVEHHEKWARSIEAYMLEGKSPSIGLRGMMARFRSWLMSIYKSMTALDVELTPEIRGVMDRMFATDAEIAAAKDEAGVEALFSDASMAGMSEVEFRAYRDTVDAASVGAQDQLQAKLMDQFNREREDWWEAERAKVRDTVAAEIQAQPIYMVLSFLQYGKLPNGDPLPENIEAVKLDRDAIARMRGKDFLKRLPKPWVYAVEGGVHPDALAQMFGFSSGDELLSAIVNARKMNDLIEAETDDQMRTTHGDMLLDGTVHDVARQAVLTAGRSEVIAAEMKALARKRREVAATKASISKYVNAERAAKIEAFDRYIPTVAAVRAIAERRVAVMKVRDLRPGSYFQASRRASKQATEAALKQDFDAALAAKQRELMAVEMYRAAMGAGDEVESAVTYLKRFGDTKKRARVGLAGPDYLDQIDGLLERFDFAKITLKAIERRKALAAWLEEKESQGLVTDVPENLKNESFRKNYRDMTIEELRGLRDSVKMIDHMAGLKNRLLKSKRKRELDAAVAEMEAAIRGNGGKGNGKRFDTRLPGEEMARGVQEFFAAHRKLAAILREMDGFEDGGPMWEYVMRPINEAADLEASMNEKATIALNEIFTTAYPAKERTALYDKTFIPSINASLTKMERLMMALNVGNAANRQRLMDGYRLTEDQLKAILYDLNEKDWKFVQGIWDHINSYWPAIEAKQQRVVGVAPEKVQGMPVETRYGTMRGAYFPIKYNERLTASVSDNLEGEFADLARNAAYVQKATTRRGHTKERLEKVELPIRLDFGVIFEHVSQVIHDLSHHEMLLDVGRLLGNKAIQQAITDKYGDIVRKQLKGVIKDIAFGAAPSPGWWKAFGYLRRGVVTASLGWNVFTSILQPFQVTNAFVRVGPKWVAKGLMRWLRNPSSFVNTGKWIEGRSEFMRLRGKTQLREINEIRNTAGLNTGKFSAAVDKAFAAVTLNTVERQDVLDSFFRLIQVGQRLADIPTWLAGYEKSQANGDDEETSIALADQAVIDSQGSGHIKDLAAVERQGEIFKTFTTFYSYANLTLNQAIEPYKKYKIGKSSLGRMLVDEMLVLMLPAVMGYFLKASLLGGGADDDESLLAALLREQVGFLLGLFIGTREFSGIAQGFDPQPPSGLRWITSAYRTAVQVGQGELDATFWKSLNDTAGILLHYPAKQVERTAAGVEALWEGETKNPGVLIFGPPRN